MTHEPILSDEQVERIKRREKDAARKRAERARKKGDSNVEEFWRRNRESANPDELKKLEARQSEILDLLFAMRKYVDGTYEELTDPEDRVSLEGLVTDVHEEMATRSTVNDYAIQDWRDASAHSNDYPTRIYLRYGILTAIPCRAYNAFHGKFRDKFKEMFETPSPRVETPSDYWDNNRFINRRQPSPKSEP